MLRTRQASQKTPSPRSPYAGRNSAYVTVLMTSCLHSDDARFLFVFISMTWRLQSDDRILQLSAVQPGGIVRARLPDREVVSGRPSETKLLGAAVIRRVPCRCSSTIQRPTGSRKACRSRAGSRARKKCSAGRSRTGSTSRSAPRWASMNSTPTRRRNTATRFASRRSGSSSWAMTKRRSTSVGNHRRQGDELGARMDTRPRERTRNTAASISTIATAQRPRAPRPRTTGPLRRPRFLLIEMP